MNMEYDGVYVKVAFGLVNSIFEGSFKFRKDNKLGSAT